MKGFEPSLSPLGPVTRDAIEEVVADKLRTFTDVELLLELRRRKVLARADYSDVAPGHAVAQGYSEGDQLVRTYRGLAHQLMLGHNMGLKPAGCKVEKGPFHPWSSHFGEQGDRKISLVLNYVVDFKR